MFGLKCTAPFDFVGNTGQWARSVCIFCGLFAPQLQAYHYAALFQNVRPSGASALEAEVEAILARAEWRDAADTAVYSAAASWLDRVEPQVRSTERYRQCDAEWRRWRR